MLTTGPKIPVHYNLRSCVETVKKNQINNASEFLSTLKNNSNERESLIKKDDDRVIAIAEKLRAN